MKSVKITKTNHAINMETPVDATIVRGKFYNNLKDDFDAAIPGDGLAKADTISEYTAGSGVTIDGVLLKDGLVQTSNLKTTTTVLTATQIVGTDAGDIGHTAGAILVPAAAAGHVYEFVSAMLILNYDTAAYTGGATDMTVRVGTVSQCAAITVASLLGAGADVIMQVNKIATNVVLTAATTINLAGTAFTNPGTAAGTLTCIVTYRDHVTTL